MHVYSVYVVKPVYGVEVNNGFTRNGNRHLFNNTGITLSCALCHTLLTNMNVVGYFRAVLLKADCWQSIDATQQQCPNKHFKPNPV